MAWQSSSISPTSTSPATDISKIKNDLQQLKSVLGGGADIDIPAFQYETWTPVVSGGTSAGTGAYTSQFGTYTRIGKLVIFSAQVGYGAHTGTGQIQVSLPAISGSGPRHVLATQYTGTGVVYSGQPLATIDPGAMEAKLWLQSGGGLAAANIASPGYIAISGHYYMV